MTLEDQNKILIALLETNSKLAEMNHYLGLPEIKDIISKNRKIIFEVTGEKIQEIG